MPLRAFWVFNGAVNRIQAEKDLRQLQLLGASQSSEAFTELHEALNKELGQPTVVIDNTSDGDAIEKLKGLQNIR